MYGEKVLLKKVTQRRAIQLAIALSVSFDVAKDNKRIKGHLELLSRCFPRIVPRDLHLATDIKVSYPPNALILDKDHKLHRKSSCIPKSTKNPK